jgi:Divergent InlB B-repeat domain
MKRFCCVLALTSALLAVPASAQTTIFGSIYNFDVYNDTGHDAHGFQVELDGLTPQQAYYNFSATRYGAPTVVPFTGGVYIRYAATYNAATQQWSATTTIPAAFTPTTGHSCVLTFVIGCDHFGTSILAQPTNTVYQWLIEDPANPGTLVTTSGGAVPGVPPVVVIPQPVINIIPPAQPANPPQVVFEIKLPDPPAAQQFGDAKWVKVYKTEVDREVGLDELVGGNPVVPEDPALLETGWKLLQRNPHSPNSGILHSQNTVNGSSHAVIRRYEFTKYSGTYDALTHEALCVIPLCATPDPSELGDYIGSQMAAVNIGVPSVTVTKNGNGTVTGAGGKINCGGTCTTIVAANSNVTLTANPGGGLFSGWGGACSGADLNCTVLVNDAINVTATFTPIYTLSIGRGGSGTVTGTPAGLQNTQINCGSNCSAKFAQGTSVTLSATPAPGVNFVSWSGACSGTVPTCSVVISSDTKVQANFK